MNSVVKNGENWLNVPGPMGTPGSEVLVHLTPMTALWMPTEDGRERLLLVRLVRIEEKEVCQGIVLDDAVLSRLLADKIADLFPRARLLPVHEPEPPQPERTMTALPFALDPGPSDPSPGPGWTPLRVGLALAWAAALVALAAVGLGGLSLLNLSERRIRFVSAVTHELRTPLTTLRLYLDMLMNGMVRDEKQRDEYIRTLNAEANRLGRLVGNVLDYSRLERSRPRLNRSPVSAAELLGRVGTVWQGRCHDADKELVIEEETSGVASAPEIRSARTASWCSKSSAIWWTTPASTAAARPTIASGCACGGRDGVSCSRWRTTDPVYRRANSGRSSGPFGAAGGPTQRRPAASAWGWRWRGAGRGCSAAS